MNTCIKCGCDDAYPSLPPCPSPTACPNPPECAEVYPAECVVLSLANITCGTDIVVFQGDSIVGAIENIVTYFCQRLVTLTDYINAQLLIINGRLTVIEGDIVDIKVDIVDLQSAVSELSICCESIGSLVESVTGLNTDNTDPQNPIVKISVDGITITGLGTPASPLIASGTPYTLPIASSIILGGIKVGDGLSIDGSGILSVTNKQKFITYPADFTGTNYTLTNADDGYSIIIINGSTAVTITVPTGLVGKMQVGFIQDGSADVTFTPSGTTLNNAISGYKIKSQYDQAYLEQGLTASIYYLLGNTKV